MAPLLNFRRIPYFQLTIWYTKGSLEDLAMTKWGLTTQPGEKKLSLYHDKVQWEKLLSSLSPIEKSYNASSLQSGEPGPVLRLNDTDEVAEIALFVPHKSPFECYGLLAKYRRHLPGGCYTLSQSLPEDILMPLLLGWALDHYSYKIQKASQVESVERSVLSIPQSLHEIIVGRVEALVCGMDLINMPANFLTPQVFEEKIQEFAKQNQMTLKVVPPKDVEKDFPCLWAVGKGAAEGPRLLSLHWKNPKAKAESKVALVGKGITFDSGGLNIKPDAAMRWMKKDMGGAASVLALAQLIIHENLPLDLSVYLPIAENAVGPDAMRPGDVYDTRKGLTVEIGHTDAEGRLVLADALTYAGEEKPNLIIDFATLTGAARVALGLEVPGFFTTVPEWREQLLKLGEALGDPLWPLPLWQSYKKGLKGTVSDLVNVSKAPYGGAITAALFLEHFIPDGAPWIHVDTMGFRLSSAPGVPEGGAILGAQTMCQFLQKWVNQHGK